MSFTRTSRLLLPISAILMVAAIVLFFKPGPNISIEFTGGTQLELTTTEERTRVDIANAASSFREDRSWIDSVSVTKTQDDIFIVRVPTLSNEEHDEFLTHLTSTIGELNEQQYTTIGPSVGESLKKRSFYALGFASIAIVLYLAFAFRKIPRSMSPWLFGVVAIIALLHDVIITAGIFTILSHVTSFQMDTLFVTALLSIMGYSVNDTIIIFDRLRDNLIEQGKRMELADLADLSLNQTLTRTFNTSVSTLVVLFALLLVGSVSIFWFILTLIVGIVVGTYSSFFVATPLLVLWKKYHKN